MVILEVEVGKYYRDCSGRVYEISHESDWGLVTTCGECFFDNGWNSGNEVDGDWLVEEVSQETYHKFQKSKKFKELDFDEEMLSKLKYKVKIK